MIEILCRQEERKPGRDRIQDINDKEIMERIIPIEQSVGRKKKQNGMGTLGERQRGVAVPEERQTGLVKVSTTWRKREA